MFEIVWNEHNIAELDFLGEATEENALEVSIAKWEVVAGFYEDYDDEILDCGGWFTCAFCLVYGQKLGKCCADCPIAEVTGYDFCYETPYDDYVCAIDADNPWAAHQAAIEELAFLRSLREPGPAQE